MRIGKVIGGILAAVLLLPGGALLAAWLFVNPNNYKEKIAAAVKQSTGRELKLSGDIKLAVFPWVALELGPASLGNLPGFGEGPFVSFTHAAVRVKLLPLLRKELEIARVELDGLDLRLVRNAQGSGNWQSPTGDGKAPNPAGAAGHGSFGSLDSLGEIRIRHGRVSYQDLVIENFDLETGSVAGEHDVPFRIGFDATRGSTHEQATVTASFELSMDAAGGMRFAAVNLSGTLNRPGDGRPSHWDFAVPTLDVNLQQQTIAAPAFSMTYSSAHVTGTLSATRILDALSATGSVVLAPVVLHEFAPRLGVVLPKTRDPKALSELSGSTEFAYDAQGVSLEKLQLKLDDTQLKGTIRLATGEVRALKFELAADTIDLDRYRAPDGHAAAGAKAESVSVSQEALSGAPKAQSQGVAAKTVAFTADGVFALAAAHAASMDFTNLKVLVAMKDGVTHLDPIEAQLDGGRFAGEVTLDQRGAIPTVSFDEHLSGVDMAKLLANTAQRGYLSGRANVTLKATARGTGADSILKTLSGHIDANLAEGAIEGLDLSYEVAQAQLLIDRKAAPPPANTKRTQFDAFKTSADITGGVAVTNDLVISSPAFKVTGQGSTNLSTKAIDLQVTASILKAPGGTLVELPMKITGTYADPTVRPDVQAVVKGEIKQKLQDVLKKNGLQGLFK
jgi:AsmA protein